MQFGRGRRHARATSQVVHHGLVEPLGLLRQIPHIGRWRRQRDGAAVGHDEAGHHLQQRRLAHPVGAHQTDALRGVDGQIDAHEHVAGAESERQITSVE